MSDTIKFSIIMAAYNAEKYIKQAIDSVIRQSYDNWELIIVDDGSKDDTGLIIDEYSQKDDRILAVHQSNSGTAGAARNTALKYVKGDYIQMLDSDDLLSADCLKIYVEGLMKDKEPDSVSIISPIAIMIDHQGREKCEIAETSKYVNGSIDGLKAFELSLDWRVHGWVAVKRELMLSVMYEETLINGDEFTTRKLLYNAKKILFTQAKYYYRDNIESTTHSNKNIVRMYETIETDRNIYDYAVNNSMPSIIVKKCLSKYCRSLVSHGAKFLREKKHYSENERDSVTRIISRNYCYAYIVFERGRCEVVTLKIFYLLTGGKLRLFFILCNIYNLMWIIKQSIKCI